MLKALRALIDLRLGRESSQVPKRSINDELIQLFAVVNNNSQPNFSVIRSIANNIDPISLNIKQSGYSLARQLAAALPVPPETGASHIGLKSGLSTQKAIESAWAAHWCRELKTAVLYHRKLWEFCFVLQALYEKDMIREGVRGLGFGCGAEPLPSYFAANGISVTVTDLPTEEAMAHGWVSSGQHATGPEDAFMSHLVSRERFDALVDMKFVDMNAIPDTLRDYDFCWSICALEHLGSIKLGLDFVEESLATLRPGGVAVHTTEFNIMPNGPTIDNWPTVAFQRSHMEGLAARLERLGHQVAPFEFDLGDGPLDKFVDLPPHHHDLPAELQKWLGDPLHLKLANDGLVMTCVGIIVEKAAAAR